MPSTPVRPEEFEVPRPASLDAPMNASFDTLMHGYLATALRVSGAAAASLCLPAGSLQEEPLLLQAGSGEPVPELSSFRRASAFLVDDWTGKAHGETCFWCRKSEDGQGYLLAFDPGAIRRSLLEQRPPDGREQRRGGNGGGQRELLWLGLSPGGKPVTPALEGLPGLSGSTLPDVPATPSEWLVATLASGVQMAWDVHLLALQQRDAVTGLPGRAEFRAALKQAFERSAAQGGCLGVMLVNPDEFGVVNHRLGQEAGDRTLAEVSARLHANLRHTDQIFRFGGAIFAVVMTVASRESVHAVAEKLRRVLTQASYAEGGVHFSFSIGAAIHDPSETSELVARSDDELLSRADQALNIAKLSGGARSLIWNPEGSDTSVGNLDRLSGIFTADTAKDYRNMLLLWETITVISAWSDMTAIGREFVGRIGASLKPERAALFIDDEQRGQRLVAASLMQADCADRLTVTEGVRLDREQQALTEEARSSGRTQRLRRESAVAGKRHIAFAVPLLSRGQSMGVLYLDGLEGVLGLDNSDLVFLDALSSQIGILLDRAQLAELRRREEEKESLRLRREVQQLRRAVGQGDMVYQSPQMQMVMETLHKVAPTDVTVLIMGESGTGKEMLAREVHQASSRSEGPFVTVDCGSIAPSLIESELFGHIRGAFTGAGQASPGRILSAVGGTLFLDEVGELPLDIQVKLLRLIQEKEITAVGSSETVKVDVRIVAATNRDLAEEVAQGRFRSDLYYRLEVITLIAPPLRERPEDILPLARHFLGRFAADLSRQELVFSQQAEHALLAHSWPGNVRELQNRILQAVITVEGEWIGEGDLRLHQEGVETTEPGGQPVTAPVSTLPAASVPAMPSQLAPLPEAESMPRHWKGLRELLREQVEESLADGQIPRPIGRWLEDDLVLLANDAADGNARRAAQLIGMAETTYRRRLEKAGNILEPVQAGRNAQWSQVLAALTALVLQNSGTDLLEGIRVLLLEEVVARVGGKHKKGAALMGVTLPTYRRWIDTKLPGQNEVGTGKELAS